MLITSVEKCIWCKNKQNACDTDYQEILGEWGFLANINLTETRADSDVLLVISKIGHGSKVNM